MAQDDMHVVMYKILAYLYSCMKQGVKPERKHYTYDGDVLHIPEQYWAHIIQELVNHGYVSGFTVFNTWGGDLIIDENEPKITLEGVEFLHENSSMQKVLRFLQETKSSLPFI